MRNNFRYGESGVHWFTTLGVKYIFPCQSHFSAVKFVWDTESVCSYCKHLVDGMGSLYT